MILNAFVSAPLELSDNLRPLQTDLKEISYHLGFGGMMRFFALYQPFPELRVEWKFKTDFVRNSAESTRQANRLVTDLYSLFFYSYLRHPKWKEIFYGTMCRRLLIHWNARPGDSIRMHSKVVLMQWQDARLSLEPQPSIDILSCTRP